MGYIIDPPNKMARTLTEKVEAHDEFITRLVASLNEALNGLTASNFADDEAAALKAVKTSGSVQAAKELKRIADDISGIRHEIEDIQRRLTTLEGGG